MTRPDRVWRDDRGVSIPFVAISMVALLGMASLVIDLGNGWRTRRALIPGTDAAALAAAQDYVKGVDGCAVSAGPYLNFNAPTAAMVSCVVGGDSVQGWVSVTGTDNVDTWFAQVFGAGDFPADSVSSAVWGPPATVTGLRPIGLCIDGSTALQDMVNNPPSGPTPITVVYNKDQPDDCGAAPGNWGIVDFDGGANSNNDTKNWIRNGYPGEVSFENHTVMSCAGEPHCYSGDTGAVSNSLKSDLDYLIDNEIWFSLPIFNFVENPGANASMHLMGVLRVRLLNYKVVGNEASRFFDFLVEPGLITGTCCGPPGGASGNKVVAICGVDPGDVLACQP